MNAEAKSTTSHWAIDGQYGEGVPARSTRRGRQDEYRELRRGTPCLRRENGKLLRAKPSRGISFGSLNFRFIEQHSRFRESG
jgi:hypothetical protein